MRTAVGNETHILKNKFAISILQGISVNVALETLHRIRVQKYTSSSIRTAFGDYHYIYSFVCNQSLFDTLIANRKCLLIVPESLSKVISFESSIENMTMGIRMVYIIPTSTSCGGTKDNLLGQFQAFKGFMNVPIKHQ